MIVEELRRLAAAVRAAGAAAPGNEERGLHGFVRGARAGQEVAAIGRAARRRLWNAGAGSGFA